MNTDVDTKKLGLELSRQLKKSVESIPGALSIIENEKILNLEDIDKKKLTRELIVLTYVGQRLAVQLIQKKDGKRNITKRGEISNALDSYSLEFLEDSPEFNNLLDQRGEQYFHLLQSHSEEISKGNWKKFLEALQSKFEQFCLGGGDEKEHIILGNFTSTMPLMMLADQYWSNGFIKTADFLKSQE